jgi:hypothetical protein
MNSMILIVPDGVGIRNFVLGRLLRQLPSRMRTHVFHDVPDEILPRLQAGTNGEVGWHTLLRFHPGRLTELLQGSLAYAQMYWADTVAMRHTLSVPIRGSWGRRCIQYAKRWGGRLTCSPRRMRFLERRVVAAVRRAPETRFWREHYQRLRPEVIFCSQQLSLDALPAIVAAHDLRIPSVAFVFSWDNLTSKGRILAPFDHYLVWSDHMARELLHYYPSLSENQVHVVGTPQFEPYVDENLIVPREQFFQELGADPRRPLICYSGGDAGTCPEDPDHLAVLLELIRAGRIRGNPQVVLRPSPVDDGKRFQPVRERFTELLCSPPRWTPGRNGNWARFYPLPEDLRLLANLTRHADMNVNLGSTMILDFCIHDKPVVNVAFDVADPPIFGMPVYDFYYRYEHLQPVLELKATRIARSVDEFAQHINEYLEDPSRDRDGRRRLVQLLVHAPIESSTDRLIETLRVLAK